MIDASILDPARHAAAWMCYCICTRLPLNAQQLDKALLPMCRECLTTVNTETGLFLEQQRVCQYMQQTSNQLLIMHGRQRR